MNFHLYQIIVVLLSAVMIFQGLQKFFSGKANQTPLKLFIRIIIWGGISSVALFPNLSNLIANFIGLEGNINAVILVGFLLVFLMIFKLLSAIERLEQQISEVTRKESLKDINQK